MKRTDEQTEFYSPFVHIPGKYEWCRIHSPSHGSFDCFILIESTTDQAVTVYVNDDKGKAFMADRYPESRCYRVKVEQLRIAHNEEAAVVSGWLQSEEGPVQEASMIFRYDPKEVPVESSYGGESFSVWGSRWSCSGVDLERKALANGYVLSGDNEILLRNEPAVATAGSYGKIELLK